VRPSSAGTPNGSSEPISWLFTSVEPPTRAKAAVPSASLGVTPPSSVVVSPARATIVYEKPGGSESRPAGSATSAP